MVQDTFGHLVYTSQQVQQNRDSSDMHERGFLCSVLDVRTLSEIIQRLSLSTGSKNIF